MKRCGHLGCAGFDLRQPLAQAWAFIHAFLATLLPCPFEFLYGILWYTPPIRSVRLEPVQGLSKELLPTRRDIRNGDSANPYRVIACTAGLVAQITPVPLGINRAHE